MAFAVRSIGLAMLLAGYAMALLLGELAIEALPAFIGLALAGVLVVQRRWPSLRIAGHTLFIVLALGLALHWIPGFFSAKVIDQMRFTPDALPFTQYLNLDKPLIGLWLLACCPWIVRARAARSTALALAVWLPITAGLCLGLALVLGDVHWAPKWPEQTRVWAFNNLLLVCITEEALFRGYFQGGLSRWLQRWGLDERWALYATAVVFGLAHAGAGPAWVVLATLAGVGYGMAWRYGGLAAAVLTHFGLNLIHFSLFSYPMLAP